MNLLKIRIIQIAPLLFWGVNVVGQSIDNHFLFNQFRDATIYTKTRRKIGLHSIIIKPQKR